jgi:para-aminobenzoate synthetase
VSVEDFRVAAAASPRMFWLERSVMGVLDDDDVSLTYDAVRREVTRHQGGRADVVGEDVFAVLAEELARDEGDPEVSWVGYLGYACRPDLPARPARGVPDAVLLRASRARTSYVSAAVAPTSYDVREGVGGEEAVPGWYAEAFARVQSELHAGNSYEVNLTYREVVESGVDPVSAYLRLRAVNPAPYAGYLQHHGVHLLSSSPERYATVDRDRTLEAKPIKGTTPRGATPEEDAAHAAHLRQDPKLRAENLMITDLLRNDLSMVCEVGSVHVPSLMEVESYPAVHQLVTTVRGRLRDDVTTVGALRALFPAGSMTGAPKRRTMAIIEEVEATPRGVYAGAFGRLSGDGRADLGVVIRSLVATGAGSGRWRYELGTGGGITVRSTVEAEWAESRWKVSRLRAALDRH